MMSEYISLGPTPADEPCAQVGDDDYDTKSAQECRRYLELLKSKFGEPEGVRFKVKSFNHDLGSYREVVIVFDPNDRDAVNFAFAVESNLPTSWT